MASGFVPASSAHRLDGPGAAGDVAVSTARSPPLGEPPHPVAEHSGREAVVRDDQPRGLRADPRAGPRRPPPGSGSRAPRGPPSARSTPRPPRTQARQTGRSPVSVSSQSTRARPCPRFPRALGVEEVVGKRAGVLFRETERADPLLDLHGGEHTYDVVSEAKLEDGVPQGPAWFVVNARDARWVHNEIGAYCGFEGRDDAAFEQLGINLNVLPLRACRWRCTTRSPGRRSFLVLRGECLLDRGR